MAGMSSPNFSRPGAVDLSALAARAKQNQAPAGQPSAGSGSGLVIQVDERSFQAAVVDRSMSVPVVVDFASSRSEQSTQFSAVLERLAVEYGGRFLVARVDVDANPQLAAAAQATTAPVVLAVLKGQVLPLFQGALPDGQVRQYLDQMLQVAQANGVTGTVEVAGADGEAEPAEPARDPRFAAADAALERGDVEGARAEFKRLLDASPADTEAKLGYVRASVLERALAVDIDAVTTAAEADPADVSAACALADVEVTGGQVQAAFNRLIAAVQRTAGDERETVRARLVELFDYVGPDDPRVPAARRALAAALF